MKLTTTETAIVGGGLLGCWTAFFLRKRGRKVVVLEKDRVGTQASGVNFGNLRIQGRHPGELPLSLRAHEQWERFEELIGADCEVERTGHIYLALDVKQIARIERYARQAAEQGLHVDLLDPAEIARRWPFLSPAHVIGASFSARDGTANPRLVTPAVARAAARLGADIRERTRVVGIDATGTGFRLSTDTGEVVACERLVNMAGAWANEIAGLFGEQTPMFAAGPPQFVTEPLPHFIDPAAQSVDGVVIFRQVGRGNVVVAGYPRGPSDKDNNRSPVPPQKTLATMQRLGEIIPALRGAHVIRVWSGIEGYIPDMLPVISPSATTPDLFHAFGFCGHGFQLGPGVGIVVSELLVDGATPTPLGDFSITRFDDPDWAGSEAHAGEFDRTLLHPA